MSTLEWIGAVLGVFAIAAIYDFCYAQYAAAAAARQATAAATWSVMTYGAGLIGFASVLKCSTWLVIPEAVGLFFGTWLGVRRVR